jgi:hypothetical protein
LDYGIQKEMIYHLFPTQMQIGKVALMTDKTPVEKRECLVSWLMMQEHLKRASAETTDSWTSAQRKF